MCIDVCRSLPREGNYRVDLCPVCEFASSTPVGGAIFQKSARRVRGIRALPRGLRILVIVDCVFFSKYSQSVLAGAYNE